MLKPTLPNTWTMNQIAGLPMLLHVALEVYPNLAVSVWHCALVFVCLLVSPSDQDLESEANPIAAHKLSLLATSTRFIIFGPGSFCL